MLLLENKSYIHIEVCGTDWRGRNLFCVLNLFHEHLCGLERGDAVLGDDDGGVLRDVAGSFFRANFDDEATETTEVYVFTVGK